MKCPSCGLENEDLHKFCSYCGRYLAPPIDSKDPKLAEGRRTILDAIGNLEIKDRVYSPMWVWFPILLMIVTSGLGFAAIFAELASWEGGAGWDPGEDPFPADIAIGYGIMIAGEVCYTIFFAVLAYLLINRLNIHFSRERAVRTGIISLLTSAADTPEKTATVNYELWQMNSLNAAKEERHDARLYGILMATAAILYPLLFPLMDSDSITSYAALLGLLLVLGLLSFVVNMYVFYFLGKDLYEHHQRWSSFTLHARSAMVKLGFYPVPEPSLPGRLPQRSFAIYLIVTIFLGIFIWYWWYALIKDPNEHFVDHSSFEAQLTRLMGPGQG